MSVPYQPGASLQQIFAPVRERGYRIEKRERLS
jgi:hypothetical protein